MDKHTLEERFWARLVESPDGCLLWTGPQQNKGYGRLEWKIAGKRHRALVHRFAWELMNGSIPKGMVIDHICHVRTCVKIAHLRMVTQKQNLENIAEARSYSKSGIRGVWWNGRTMRWNVQVGHNGKNYWAGSFVDLTEAEAAAIAKRSELHTPVPSLL